jgi:serine O-acetyltransferase
MYWNKARKRECSKIKKLALLLLFLPPTVVPFQVTRTGALTMMQTAAPLYPTNNPPIKSFQHATTTIPNDVFTELSFEDSLEQLNIASIPFVGSFFDTSPDWKPLVDALVHNQPITHDPLWQQIQAQATQALQPEPEAGPQLYQGILSHSNLVDAICGIVANEIETSLMPATALKNLFTATLTPHDVVAIHLDVMAVATKSASIQNMAMACLFHKGLHAMVCFRVGHGLWGKGRTGLAYYMQSTVSAKYSADIHPAAKIGNGIYLNAGGGIVIGETAVVGNDVCILQGVTLGGTGTEKLSDRHPKVGMGVILHEGSTVLGNIPVGDGAIVMPKSIVTKPVPPLARVSGIPARIVGYRDLEQFVENELEVHLGIKYKQQWQQLQQEQNISSVKE